MAVVSNSASSVRQMVGRSMLRLFLQQERGLATRRSLNLSTPAMMAQVSAIDFHHIPSGGSPACGWRKSIVSSASSLPELDEVEELQSLDQMSMAETARITESADASLTLEVDMAELHNLASMRCTPLSLKDMYKYAVDFADSDQRLRNAQFLHKELPIRIAQRAVDLLTLPHGLSDVLPIRQISHVYLLYLEKFQEISAPTTQEEEDAFTDMLQSMVLDRSSIPTSVAQGVDEWLQIQYAPMPETSDDDSEDDEAVEGLEIRLREMEDALYRFFTARTGLRFLTEHHILSSPTRREIVSALRKSQSALVQDDDVDDEFLGCIQTDCDPASEVRKVAHTVKRQTEEYYGICPEIQIVDSTQKDTKFTYVPHHLHYMVGELIKNSCRAVTREFLDSDQSQPIPPIRVVVVKGEEDVTIKVADRGGGIPRSSMVNVWKFAHSTAGEDESLSDFGADEVTETQIRGFGLPLARIYARYLGGELTMKSMEGYGLDAYLHLPRLGDSCEKLPLPVKFSPGELNSNPPRRAVTTRPKYSLD